MAPSPTMIYTLSLHDALPISSTGCRIPDRRASAPRDDRDVQLRGNAGARALLHQHRPARLRADRSEEHTSELQSHSDLVCRLLLEKKKRANTGLRRDASERVR